MRIVWSVTRHVLFLLLVLEDLTQVWTYFKPFGSRYIPRTREAVTLMGTKNVFVCLQTWLKSAL